MSAEPGRLESGLSAGRRSAPGRSMAAVGRPAGLTPHATWRELIEFATGAIGDRREAQWILEDAAGTSGPTTASGLDVMAPGSAAERIVEMVTRRRGGEPLQHVLGHWSFRALEVAVDSRALIPRPETEVVTEVALNELDRLAAESVPERAERRFSVVDLGTGSGVIALSIATERAFAEVMATDRSPEALALAAENVRRQPFEVRSRLTLACGEWYSPLPSSMRGGVSIVVSNPPYVTRSEWEELDPVVRLHDPYEALVSGDSGLEAIEAVVRGAEAWLASRGAVVVEIAPHQAGQARAIARSVEDLHGRPLFESVEVLPDLAGRARVLRAIR
jgi:release factor glutamine methyltransferase